jgi:hypothetical protein
VSNEDMIKRLSKYLAFSALAIAAGFFGGVLAELSRASSSPRRVPVSVRAKRFEVVDDGGKVVTELTGGALNLFDGAGKIRATLRLGYNDNGVLAFSDRKWDGRATFGFLGTDTPSQTDDDWGLVIHNPEGRMPIASLTTTDNGWRGWLHVASRKGVRNISAP